MTKEERAMAIDADGLRVEFRRRMAQICSDYHTSKMTIRERVQEEVKAINGYARNMADLVQP